MKNNTLVIAVTTGKGGAEFNRECNAFADHHRQLGNNVTVHKLKHDKQWKQYHKVLGIIDDYPNQIHHLVFFCHGTWKRLKCGFHIWNVNYLVNTLKHKVDMDVNIVLYSCSCGRARFDWPWSMSNKTYNGVVKGKEGFAARLANELKRSSITANIYCHSSWGHTTRNPYVYKYANNTNTIVRYPIVQKGSPEWKAWRERLKTDYRFDAPFE